MASKRPRHEVSLVRQVFRLPRVCSLVLEFCTDFTAVEWPAYHPHEQYMAGLVLDLQMQVLRAMEDGMCVVLMFLMNILFFLTSSTGFVFEGRGFAHPERYDFGGKEEALNLWFFRMLSTMTGPQLTV